MFWRKMGTALKGKERVAKKIEGSLWEYMVRQGVRVGILQNLKQVEHHGVIEGKPAIMIYIFDPAAADKKGVTIEDYESLRDNPELVLYEGYCRESGGRLDIHMEKK